MPSIWSEFKKYLGDALPGGALNPELTTNINESPMPVSVAALRSFLGEAPDELGVSALHPQRTSIMKVAEPAFAAGTALQVAPIMGGLSALKVSKGALGGALADQAGKILIHGGPAEVRRVDPSRFTQQVHGPGFYLSDKTFTPQTFATSGGKRSGVLSVYDFPDELYASMLNASSKPLNPQSKPAEALGNLLQKYPDLYDKLRGDLKLWVKGDRTLNPAATAESSLTGERVEQLLRSYFGNDDLAHVLGEEGVPGKTWVYSAERPAEKASVVYPSYVGDLKFLDSFETSPGELKQTTQRVKDRLSELGYARGGLAESQGCQASAGFDKGEPGFASGGLVTYNPAEFERLTAPLRAELGLQ